MVRTFKKSFCLALIGISALLLVRSVCPPVTEVRPVAEQSVLSDAQSQVTVASESGPIADLYEKEMASKNRTVRDYYLSKLEHEDAVLWDEITTTTGLTYDEANREKEKIKASELKRVRARRRHKKPRIAPGVLALADEVIDDFGVDKNQLTIVAGESTSVGACELMLCEHQLRGMPKEGARAVVAHEMIHVERDDSFLREAMYDLLLKKGINADKLAKDHPFYKHMRFEEMRADILSCLKDVTYACGAVESLSVLVQYRDGASRSHPRPQDRLAAVQEVVDLLKYEQARPHQI